MATCTAAPLRHLATHAPAPAPPFCVTPLLFCKRLLEDAIHESCRFSRDRRRRALEAAAWIRRPGTEPGSFSWCVLYLGIHAIRNLLNNDCGRNVPGYAALRQRLQALPDSATVAQIGHLLIEHARVCWNETPTARRWIRLSAETWTGIRRRAAAGESHGALAEEFGLATTTVRANTGPPPRPPRREIPPALRAEASRLVRLGETQGRIAEKLGLTTWDVARLAAELREENARPGLGTEPSAQVAPLVRRAAIYRQSSGQPF